jgi:hypothetical protein
MRSPLSYIVGSTYILFLSLVPALTPVMAEQAYTPTYKYPKEVISGGINGCMSKRGNVDPEIMRQICYCLSQAVQDRYSLSQFIDIAREMSATGTPNPEVKEITIGCAAAVIKKNSSR